MTVRADTDDRPPAPASGNWLFAWGSAAFLIALILAAIAVPSDGALPPDWLTSAELRAGKAGFDGEGCAACHSRMVRDADRGMGIPASEQLLLAMGAYPGSSRIGPDLQNLHRRYPRSLLETRLTDPGMLQPGTVMPSYSHLSDAQRAAIVSYLEMSAGIPGGWEAIRARNRIEAAVPDEILVSLSGYFDFETGVFISPIRATPEFLITGSGIYNSRCAACHGLEGRGDGPVAWQGWEPGSTAARGPAPLVPPADLTKPELGDSSLIMLYWRISEGVPGTGMPAWSGVLSEDALWFLVGYIRSLSTPLSDLREIDVGPDRAGTGSSGVYEELPFSPFDNEYPATGTEAGVGAIPDNLEPADSASEEEGTSTIEGESSDDVLQSVGNTNQTLIEEDSP